jgi:hypothetical protein
MDPDPFSKSTDPDPALDPDLDPIPDPDQA